ncbi:MAG: endopeptidase La [Bacteroidaceae bacterium]|nr:endopeptidase La [Bacteroidaceae bacterium]
MKELFDEIITEEGGGQISLYANFDEPDKKLIDFTINPEELIPILPLKGVMLFPNNILPIGVSRKSSQKLIEDALKKNKHIGVFSQTDDSVNKPGVNEIYHTGVIAKVLRIIRLPDGSQTALLQGFQRIRLIFLDESKSYLQGQTELYPEEVPPRGDRKFSAVVEACKDTANKLMRSSESLIGAAFALNNITDKPLLINFICANLPVDNKERIVLLEETNIYDRAYKLLGLLNREYQFFLLKHNLQQQTREQLDKQQRDYFLRQEIERIHEELGDSEEDSASLTRLRMKADAKRWSEEMKNYFDEEMKKINRLNPQSPDYQTAYSYLDTLTDLPWDSCTKDNLSIPNAERTLNRDHYGMEKVKERILEHLAVLKMRGDFKSPIICLYGPPGVGKTSLGKSIATAMKRKYVRMSLGGIHDEAEIRGHRRTYVGAMPGRIIKNIIKAKSSNPVFILDEIDKVTQATMHGDPASALLEVLDPEQNSAFHDNYLDVDYDLSKVMFIATANNVSNIPAPLLDRMELIEVSGYLTEEKIEIARRHLVPKALENLGMKDSGIKLTKAAIEKIIEDYTRESGVRALDKKITELLRKVTLEYTKTEALPDHDLKPEDVKKYLGIELFQRDKYEGNALCGVVTGLAWTSVGGEILYIETSYNESKQGGLSLTGNLGDVMKESATIALQYLKANPELLGTPPELPKAVREQLEKDGMKHTPTWADFFATHNIHIHVPEGATPKDGPSAGITIATSIASAITGRKVRKSIAMTGEITLRGKVLPIGGVKEKILAAKRAGITHILCCEENRRNVEDIPAIYVKGLTFHYVETVKDVLDFALI